MLVRVRLFARQLLVHLAAQRHTEAVHAVLSALDALILAALVLDCSVTPTVLARLPWVLPRGWRAPPPHSASAINAMELHHPPGSSGCHFDWGICGCVDRTCCHKPARLVHVEPRRRDKILRRGGEHVGRQKSAAEAWCPRQHASLCVSQWRERPW